MRHIGTRLVLLAAIGMVLAACGGTGDTGATGASGAGTQGAATAEGGGLSVGAGTETEGQTDAGAETEGQTDAGEETEGQTDAATEADGVDEPQVAFIPQIVGIPYYDGFEEGAQRAAEEFGVDYVQSGPAQADPSEQLRILEGFITQGFDAIVVSPLDPTTLDNAISEAVDAGILVAASDADAPGTDRAFYVAQATDQALGYTLIDNLVEQIGGEGQIGIVSGVANTPSLDAWVEFMQERIETTYPDVEVVGGVRHAPDSETALSEAQSLMTAFPEIDGLVGVPSTAVPGVAQAVQNAGKAGEIAVIGYGSPNTARPFIESGVMETTVLWDVEQLGYLTVWAVDYILEGNEFEPENDVPGFDEPVAWDEETQTLLLGPPVIYDESNVGDFDF